MATQERNAEAQKTAQGAQEPPAAGQPAGRTAAATRLIEQLAARGFGLVDDFVEPGLLAALRAHCTSMHDSGELRAARIGRGTNQRLEPEVRGDLIAWLPESQVGAGQELLERIEELRVALNRGLMAGLEDFEGHFALYPPGAAYARHSDRLAGTDIRAISVVLYLNESWSAEQGGELRIHTDAGRFQDVLPLGGRLVAFRSDRFEHEVLPARRARMSFTGWFRRRPLGGCT